MLKQHKNDILFLFCFTHGLGGLADLAPLRFQIPGVPLSSNDNCNDIVWVPHCLNKDRIYDAPQSIKNGC